MLMADDRAFLARRPEDQGTHHAKCGGYDRAERLTSLPRPNSISAFSSGKPGPREGPL